MQTRISVAHGGATAKALDYSIKRWPALMRYADSGVLPIDNNPVENCRDGTRGWKPGKTEFKLPGFR